MRSATDASFSDDVAELHKIRLLVDILSKQFAPTELRQLIDEIKQQLDESHAVDGGGHE